MKIKIDVSTDDLRKTIWWCYQKFHHDEMSRKSGASAKANDIGGFIERWVNKSLVEEMVFAHLFKNTGCKPIIDNFIYKGGKKDGSDLIGIEKNNKIIQLCKFNDGTWEKEIQGMHIELKAFEENKQYLFSIRETQTTCDYLLITTHDFKKDYLINIFNEKFLENSYSLEYKNLIEEDNQFIKSDLNNDILRSPLQIKTSDIIGSIYIYGIFKIEDFIRFSSKIDGGEKFYYYLPDSAEKNVPSRHLPNENKFSKLSKIGKLEKEIFQFNAEYHSFIKETFNKSQVCKFSLKTSNLDNIEFCLLSSGPSYIKVKGPPIVLEGETFEEGIHKLKFNVFDRSAQYSEYFFPRSLIGIMQDYTDKIINDIVSL